MKKKILIGFLTVVMCFALVGCGKSEVNDPDLNDDINNNEKGANNNETGTEEEIKLYSDDTKIVFANGQAKLVYYYSGEKITAYHAYMDYENNVTANYALSIIDKNDTTIKKAYTKGKYLIIEYAESEYEDTTLSEVKALYSYLEQIQKSN